MTKRKILHSVLWCVTALIGLGIFRLLTAAEEIRNRYWIEEVLAVYDAMISEKTYYPKSTKFIGGR